MRSSALAAIVGAIVIGGAPMAQAQEGHTPGDPWEHANRQGYAVQTALDRYFFGPAADLFKHLSPGPIGHGIHNFIVNLSEPNAFINDVLQFRLKRAAIPAGRFVTNTTIGILGLFDVADGLGMHHHDNEFGVTMGRYGIGPGPYMFVPLIGPTTVRDVIGSGIDALIDPIHWASYANRPEISIARAVVAGLDLRVSTGDQLKALLSDATDPYATLRSVYLQNKEAEIHGESLPVDSLPSFDDPPVAPPAPAPATAGAVIVEEAPETPSLNLTPSIKAPMTQEPVAVAAPVSTPAFQPIITLPPEPDTEG
jgi:phospholipid-binding lipoprotein MlaA